MGGMFGESKFGILKRIDPTVRPRTILILWPTDAETVVDQIRAHGMSFPLIFKPDLGERGHMVKRIANDLDISRYIEKIKTDFIVQDLVDLPCEFGVFYARVPGEKKGRVTSVVGKEMLSVTGDGQRTLQELIFKNERAILQWDQLRDRFGAELGKIVPAGKRIELVSIGNHCRGTKFLDRTDLINDRLHEVFDQISKTIEGFYFGRFDLRCASEEDLYSGKVMIMELNGCGAEPAHIYQPGFSFFAAIKVLIRHWKQIYIIADKNRQQGYRYTSLSDARKYYRKFKRATS